MLTAVIMLDDLYLTHRPKDRPNYKDECRSYFTDKLEKARVFSSVNEAINFASRGENLKVVINETHL